MNETTTITYNTARNKASVSLLTKDGTVGKMISNLFDRCFIENLNFAEYRYETIDIKAFSTINLLDACLICKNHIPKEELNQ